MHKLKDNLVWVGLALTLLLVVFVEMQDGPDNSETDVFVVAPDHVQTQSVQTQATQTQTIQSQTIQPQKSLAIAKTDNSTEFALRKKIIDVPVNVFALPKPKQEIQPVAVAPRAPATPVNPYTYVGKLIEDGEMRVFLTNGRDNYVVRAGDTLEEVWQVKAIHSTEMILLNLPTQTQIRVAIGAVL
ncbi:MAG: hypothetical protein CMH22_02500 [Methylophaga sp.]|uniref:hypothetical protein n=1 Tax=Methylophaga sp. UBA678 TaxID=1946901 RepID=UPI000C4C15C1|nr:hypothetical protein [Methylophaga sp. UBA678]MAX50833.1 hypothetical protein [Methylophaga sp.]|tara:strand:- start:18939 stop:19496 length:558 start_codon:yes stop_codon:yes gene_type:complete